MLLFDLPSSSAKHVFCELLCPKQTDRLTIEWFHSSLILISDIEFYDWKILEWDKKAYTNIILYIDLLFSRSLGKKDNFNVLMHKTIWTHNLWLNIIVNIYLYIAILYKGEKTTSCFYEVQMADIYLWWCFYDNGCYRDCPHNRRNSTGCPGTASNSDISTEWIKNWS